MISSTVVDDPPQAAERGEQQQEQQEEQQRRRWWYRHSATNWQVWRESWVSQLCSRAAAVTCSSFSCQWDSDCAGHYWRRGWKGFSETDERIVVRAAAAEQVIAR